MSSFWKETEKAPFSMIAATYYYSTSKFSLLSNLTYIFLLIPALLFSVALLPTCISHTTYKFCYRDSYSKQERQL